MLKKRSNPKAAAKKASPTKTLAKRPTRKFYVACLETDEWLVERFPEIVATTSPHSSSARATKKVGAAPPLSQAKASVSAILSTVLRESPSPHAIVGALPPQLRHVDLSRAVTSLSWTQLTIIIGACDRPAERYFYMSMSVRERWSVRELRRQIDAALFERYVSVKRDPEKCLPTDAEHGDLLPFKDHYVLEFLGLEDEHTEKELRKAILGNLRDFFLEFGKDLTFVGEEYPLTVGADTLYIDLLFFHRRLQCLISVDLKIGKFKPEYAGKSQFYCAALDEQLRLPHENPSIGLVLCKTADHAQVRLALTAAARKIGIATYQTVLPDEHLLEQRLARLPMPQESEP